MRLNVLPALFGEAYSHLHRTLCASAALGRRLFVQPFHRDVRVTPALLAAMRSSLAYCQQTGGVLLATPERRLSQRLKRLELWEQWEHSRRSGGGASDALWQGLLSLEQGLPWVDILDESDELLAHK